MGLGISKVLVLARREATIRTPCIVKLAENGLSVKSLSYAGNLRCLHRWHHAQLLPTGRQVRRKGHPWDVAMDESTRILHISFALRHSAEVPAQRSRQAPIDIPPPNPANSARSPSFSRPTRLAASRATGTDALPTLP